MMGDPKMISDSKMMGDPKIGDPKMDDPELMGSPELMKLTYPQEFFML